jgi:uncharacterized protein
VSAGVVATLAVRHLASVHHFPGWGAVPAGAVAGGLTTSTTTAGPPLLVYLLGRTMGPAQMRDTVTVVFLGLGFVGAAALWATGTTGAVPDATLVAILVPVVVAGHLLGRPIFARLARSGRYEPVLTAALLVAVVAGLATAMA